jgi:amino acid transporter
MKGAKELFFYVTVSCGMTLATSVFTMISGLFEITTGPGALVGIALAGFFCLIIALSIGELASMYPSAPAVRTYLKTAFGDRASLLLVYLYLISVVLVAGLESFIFSQVFHAAFPAATALPTIVILLCAITAVNLVGLELPRSVQMIATVGVVLFIAISGSLGFLSPRIPLTSQIGPVTPELLRSLPAAAGLAVFLYMGFEWVTPVGLRPSSYHWKVPISMAISVGVLIITFGVFVLGAASQLPRHIISSTPVPQVGYLTAIYGPTGVYLALALALAATVSTFNAGIMGGSRLIYLLAREGHFPEWCASLSLRTGAPVAAVLLLSSLALVSAIAVMAWGAALLVAVIGAAIICVLYAAFLLSALVLRKRRPDAPRPYRNRLWSPLQWFGVIALPLLGLQTLISEPSLGTRPVYGGALALILAALLTRVYGVPRPAGPGDKAPVPATQSFS